jgi:hypothetical protein
MMKRLLGLAVLFAVLSVWVPSSYGAPPTYHCLVYNVSTTVKGGDMATNLKATIPLKGYLVLRFADGCDTPIDANLILYGNDANTPKKKVYVQLNTRGEDSLTASGWTIGDLMFVNIWGEDPFEFEIMLQGKQTLKDIGFGTDDKRMVASSIKGVNITESGFLLGPNAYQEISGTANASATLNTSVTKQLNENGWGPNAAEDILLSLLLNKGYVAAILPDL